MKRKEERDAHLYRDVTRYASRLYNPNLKAVSVAIKPICNPASDRLRSSSPPECAFPTMATFQPSSRSLPTFLRSRTVFNVNLSFQKSGRVAGVSCKAAALVTMPEAAMNEDGRLARVENDVGLSRQAFSVKPVAKPMRSHPLSALDTHILIASTTIKESKIMRMNLYQAEIIDPSETSTRYLVAVSADHATEIIRHHYRAIGDRLTKTDIRRIDEDLEGERRTGLDVLLQKAPAGFASYCEADGWKALPPEPDKLHLFRIEDAHGTETYVIAPDANIASMIHVCDEPLGKDEQRTISIYDGLVGLPVERIANIHELLEAGPIGIAEYAEVKGWTVL